MKKVIRGFQFPWSAQLEAAVRHAHGASGDVFVFLAEPVFDFLGRESEIGEFFGHEFHPDFPFTAAGHFNFQDACYGLDLVCQVVCNVLKPGMVHGSA